MTEPQRRVLAIMYEVPQPVWDRLLATLRWYADPANHVTVPCASFDAHGNKIREWEIGDRGYLAREALSFIGLAQDDKDEDEA